MHSLSGETWAITGAAGTIGTRLRHHLRPRVSHVVLLDAVETPDLHPTESALVADLRDESAMVSALSGCAGVIHLGGIPDEADFHDLIDVNIAGTYHVYEAARRNGLRRVVYASSNRLTGFYPSGELVDPAMPPRPDGFYGVSKVAGEALGQLYADKFGVSSINVRIGSYEDEPAAGRTARTWLSPADGMRAFDAAVTTPEHTATFYAVSRNRDRWWSLTAGEKIGYHPQDDATAVLDTIGAVPSARPQGGDFASAQFSLDRMRPLAP